VVSDKMIDIGTFVVCMVFVSLVGTGLYRHFNSLFEMQYELTTRLIQQVKPLIQEVPDSVDNDFLYGVSYEVESSEEE